MDVRDIQICLGHDESGDTPFGASTPPIFETASFRYPSFQSLLDGLAAEHAHPVYSRGQNPTVEVLERKLAELERGEACKCFASGMGAIHAALMGLLEHGDHVVTLNQIYGPTLQALEHLQRFGVSHDRVLDLDPEAIERALTPATKILWIESPGTMTFRQLDIAAVVDLARARGITTVMDNSWATPLLQKPLTMGVDVVVHSASKYIGGHDDVVAGALVTRRELLQQIYYRAYLLGGAALGPFEAWLLIRGLRTLPARLEQQGRDASTLARFLSEHARVRRVFHPEHRPEEAELTTRQLAGVSGLFAFELDTEDFEEVRRTIDALRLFKPAVSWGGVGSVVISPNRGSNEAELREKRIPPGLIRLSVGLEGAESLVADLETALAQ